MGMTECRYADWFKFNTAQRAHYSGIENFSPFIVFLVLGGLFFPQLSAGLGVAYLIGRQLYASGYFRRGPAGRTAGAALVDAALFIQFGVCVYAGLLHAGVITFKFV